MKVQVWLKGTSQEISYGNVRNTYQKGSLFCLMLTDGTVVKYPIADIFRVTEQDTPATK